MKRKLADVLWEAANVFLAHDPANKASGTECYSCPAVGMATGCIFLSDEVRAFLTALGCDTYSAELLHREWAHTKASQGVRYMWLLLAMHVAEDENIEIEVNQC
jgi:hypothetical protein